MSSKNSNKLNIPEAKAAHQNGVFSAKVMLCG